MVFGSSAPARSTRSSTRFRPRMWHGSRFYGVPPPPSSTRTRPTALSTFTPGPAAAGNDSRSRSFDRAHGHSRSRDGRRKRHGPDGMEGVRSLPTPHGDHAAASRPPRPPQGWGGPRENGVRRRRVRREQRGDGGAPARKRSRVATGEGSSPPQHHGPATCSGRPHFSRGRALTKGSSGAWKWWAESEGDSDSGMPGFTGWPDMHGPGNGAVRGSADQRGRSISIPASERPGPGVTPGPGLPSVVSHRRSRSDQTDEGAGATIGLQPVAREFSPPRCTK
jgi:hypothetical protein